MNTTLRRAATLAAVTLVGLGTGAGAASATGMVDENDPAFWEAVLEDPEGEFGFVDVDCFKIEPGSYADYGDYLEDDFDGDGTTEWGFAPYDPWLAMVLKAGSDESTDGANELALFVEPDSVFWHSSGKEISHIILCDGDIPEEPEPSTPEPSEPEPSTPEPSHPEPTHPATTPGQPGDDSGAPLGPVVQTDMPAQAGVNPALPLALLAAAGLGLAAVGVRRASRHDA